MHRLGALSGDIPPFQDGYDVAAASTDIPARQRRYVTPQRRNQVSKTGQSRSVATPIVSPLGGMEPSINDGVAISGEASQSESDTCEKTTAIA